MTSQEQATTVQLSQVNASAEKKPGFFERGIKGVVNFIAKATGQPAPQN